MGRFVNPGNSAFKVALASEIYIDKTGLLDFTNSVLGTKQAYICNSRPRRFGKSITADMLTAYYSKGCDSRELFMNYNIAQTEYFEKYLNKYDVIHLDMQWILMDAGAPERISGYINKNVISELADLYKDIDLRDQKTLYGALSVINSMTNNKFVIIIDEWDVLIRDEAANSSVQEEYINFMRGMFKGSEPTKYIELAFLTGILPIKKLKTQSALNNFDEYTMLYAGRLSPYIGFTEDEVRDICDRYGRDFSQVERWYDGYMLGDYHVYNPRAVVNYMLQGDLKSYWSETGSYDVIVPLINLDFDGLKTAIIQMLSGGEIKVNTGSFMNDTVSFKNKDDVLTYLVHLGYLGFDQKKSCAFIPNEEIRQELLAAADMLITDYSSCIWDYSFLYRPCFLYTPDLLEYLAKTGFYVDIHEWPFPICENMEDLEKQIRSFDEEKNRARIMEHHQQMGSYESGHACEAVCSWIKQKSICEENA